MQNAGLHPPGLNHSVTGHLQRAAVWQPLPARLAQRIGVANGRVGRPGLNMGVLRAAIGRR